MERKELKNLKEGDEVYVSSWEDLVEKYGEPDEDGDIFIDGHYFNEEWNGICGQWNTVTYVNSPNSFYVDEEDGELCAAMISEVIFKNDCKDEDENEPDQSKHKFKVGDKLQLIAMEEIEEMADGDNESEFNIGTCDTSRKNVEELLNYDKLTVSEVDDDGDLRFEEKNYWYPWQIFELADSTSASNSTNGNETTDETDTRTYEEIIKMSVTKEAVAVKAETESVSTLQEQLEKALAERYKMASGVKREGKEIIVPPFMTLTDASKAIAAYEKDMESNEDSFFELHAHPFDCAFAFNNAMSEIYGALISQSTMGFWGPINAKSVVIPTSHKDNIKVPIGAVAVPGLPIKMTVSVYNPNEWHPGEVGTVIQFTNKRKFGPLVQEIEAKTKEYLAKRSLFKGKAIDSAYKFINLDTFSRERVTYSAEQIRQLEANVFTLIKNADAAVAANIPLKRGILLHGPYGTGKTLTALYAASLCVENDWTFILVRPHDDIDAAIEMAQKLQPACVFFEDIDAAAGEDRDADVNAILNTIDGVLSKDSKVMVILTTNHIEKVNPAMLRPGRLDAVIKLGTLDKAAVIRFVTDCATDSKGNCMIAGLMDEDAVFRAAEGYVPAFLKEAVSKATLYSIARGDKTHSLTTDDIVSAMNELRPQYEMMVGERTEKKVTVEEMFRNIAEQTAAEFNETVLNGDGSKTGNYKIGPDPTKPRKAANAKKATK
jgi:transitional endoplasmic reticulum ATPase